MIKTIYWLYLIDHNEIVFEKKTELSSFPNKDIDFLLSFGENVQSFKPGTIQWNEKDQSLNVTFFVENHFSENDLEQIKSDRSWTNLDSV